MMMFEYIEAAIPTQPKLGLDQFAQDSRVYRSGHSHPAKATTVASVPGCWSISKRPFPPSQSNYASMVIEDDEYIEAAIPTQPKRPLRRLPRRTGVYRSGHSHPAKAKSAPAPLSNWNISKRPFPPSQSDSWPDGHWANEYIEAAIPTQPKPNESDWIGDVEYIEAAIPTQPKRGSHAYTPPPEYIEAAIPTQPKPNQVVLDCMERVYRSGHSHPAKACSP